MIYICLNICLHTNKHDLVHHRPKARWTHAAQRNEPWTNQQCIQVQVWVRQHKQADQAGES